MGELYRFSCIKKNLPRLLESLASRKQARAMKASHEVWTALCSGDVYQAAEPAFPFLIEILGISEPSVQGEILDIFLKFTEVPEDDSAEDWQKNLRNLLRNEYRFFNNSAIRGMKSWRIERGGY